MAVRRLTALVAAMPRRTAARLVAAMTHAAARAARRPEAEIRRTSRGERIDDGRSMARPRERADAAAARPHRSAEG